VLWTGRRHGVLGTTGAPVVRRLCAPGGRARQSDEADEPPDVPPDDPPAVDPEVDPEVEESPDVDPEDDEPPEGDAPVERSGEVDPLPRPRPDVAFARESVR
jgi:hypothetical protein